MSRSFGCQRSRGCPGTRPRKMWSRNSQDGHCLRVPWSLVLGSGCTCLWSWVPEPWLQRRALDEATDAHLYVVETEKEREKQGKWVSPDSRKVQGQRGRVNPLAITAQRSKLSVGRDAEALMISWGTKVELSKPSVLREWMDKGGPGPSSPQILVLCIPKAMSIT